MIEKETMPLYQYSGNSVSTLLIVYILLFMARTPSRSLHSPSDLGQSHFLCMSLMLRSG